MDCRILQWTLLIKLIFFQLEVYSNQSGIQLDWVGYFAPALSEQNGSYFFIFGTSFSEASLKFCCMTGWTTLHVPSNRSSFPFALESATLFVLRETSFFSLQVCCVFPWMKFSFLWLTSMPDPFALIRRNFTNPLLFDLFDLKNFFFFSS